MFIKFTRLDGTPIWINSTFVVTVEPRRNGGRIGWRGAGRRPFGGGGDKPDRRVRRGGCAV